MRPAQDRAHGLGRARRTLSGALLLGCAYKDLEYITLRFDCDGPVGGIVTEAGAGGAVRGYVKNPAAHLPPNSLGNWT